MSQFCAVRKKEIIQPRKKSRNCQDKEERCQCSIGVRNTEKDTAKKKGEDTTKKDERCQDKDRRCQYSVACEKKKRYNQEKWKIQPKNEKKKTKCVKIKINGVTMLSAYAERRCSQGKRRKYSQKKQKIKGVKISIRPAYVLYTFKRIQL